MYVVLPYPPEGTVVSKGVCDRIQPLLGGIMLQKIPALSRDRDKCTCDDRKQIEHYIGTRAAHLDNTIGYECRAFS